MSFAQEMKDFSAAFKTHSDLIGSDKDRKLKKEELDWRKEKALSDEDYRDRALADRNAQSAGFSSAAEQKEYEERVGKGGGASTATPTASQVIDRQQGGARRGETQLASAVDIGDGDGKIKFTGDNRADPRLGEIMQAASTTLPAGWNVQLTSSLRPGDKRFHGKGQAVDVQLIDPDGKKLANYQDASTFGIYQKFANAARQAQEKLHPDLSNTFRWGGYFGGPKGKYGALDLMHFDTGGAGMAGGTWNEGLKQAQADIWGLKPGGGLRGMPAQTQVAARTPPNAGTVAVTPAPTAAAPATAVAAKPTQALPAPKPSQQPAGGTYVAPGTGETLDGTGRPVRVGAADSTDGAMPATPGASGQPPVAVAEAQPGVDPTLLPSWRPQVFANAGGAIPQPQYFAGGGAPVPTMRVMDAQLPQAAAGAAPASGAGYTAGGARKVGYTTAGEKWSPTPRAERTAGQAMPGGALEAFQGAKAKYAADAAAKAAQQAQAPVAAPAAQQAQSNMMMQQMPGGGFGMGPAMTTTYGGAAPASPEADAAWANWFNNAQMQNRNEGGMIERRSAIPRYARGGSVDRPMQARRTASGGVDYDDWQRLHREAAKYDPSSGQSGDRSFGGGATAYFRNPDKAEPKKEAPKKKAEPAKKRADPDHTGTVTPDNYPDESTRRPGRVDPYPDEATRRPQPTTLPPQYEGGMGTEGYSAPIPRPLTSVQGDYTEYTPERAPMYIGRGQQWPAPGPGVVEGPVARPAFVPPAPHDSGGPQSNRWLNPPPVDRYMGPTYRRMQQGEYFPSSDAYNRPEGLTPAIPRPAPQIPPGMTAVKQRDGTTMLVPLGFDSGRFGGQYDSGGMVQHFADGGRAVMYHDQDDWDRRHAAAAAYDPSTGQTADRDAAFGAGATAYMRNPPPAVHPEEQKKAGERLKKRQEHYEKAKPKAPPPGEADQPTHSIPEPYPDEATRRPQPTALPPSQISPEPPRVATPPAEAPPAAGPGSSQVPPRFAPQTDEGIPRRPGSESQAVPLPLPRSSAGEAVPGGQQTGPMQGPPAPEQQGPPAPAAAPAAPAEPMPPPSRALPAPGEATNVQVAEADLPAVGSQIAEGQAVPIDPDGNAAANKMVLAELSKRIQGPGGQEILNRNVGAASQAEMNELYKTTDPKNLLPEEAKNMKVLNDAYDFWMSKGRPDKAAEMVVGIGLYNRKMSQRYGLLAQAGFEAGRPEEALKMLQKAYNFIPDGLSMSYELSPDKKTIRYTMFDPQTGERFPPQEAPIEDAAQMAQTAASGMAWYNMMNDTASKRGRGGGAPRPTPAGKEAKPSKDERAAEAAEQEYAQREADARRAFETETDPERKKQLGFALKALPYDQAFEANQAKNRAKISEDDLVTLEKASTPAVRGVAESILTGNPNMSTNTAVKLAEELTSPKFGPNSGFAPTSGNRYSLPGYTPFYITFGILTDARRAQQTRKETDKTVPK